MGRRISTYDVDMDLNIEDSLIGTDYSLGANNPTTKTFTLGDIKEFFESLPSDFQDNLTINGLFKLTTLIEEDGAKTLGINEDSEVVLVNRSEAEAGRIVNVNESVSEPSTVRIWTGTEAEYQILSMADQVEEDVIYHRRA